MKQRQHIIVPEGLHEVLLHACCAPCSSAIVEWLIGHDIQPTIFYFNPNIYPLEEYEIRKQESKRHAESLGIRWLDGDYDHASWQQYICGYEQERERGRRCLLCFRQRLLETAKVAKKEHFSFFATTLASSRWKSLEQIELAGNWAASVVNEEDPALPVTFWAQNWRRDGLQQRRQELLREYDFYNQQYCGCEYSMPSSC